MNRNVVDCCSYGEIAIMKDDFYEWLKKKLLDYSEDVFCMDNKSYTEDQNVSSVCLMRQVVRWNIAGMYTGGRLHFRANNCDNAYSGILCSVSIG